MENTENRIRDLVTGFLIGTVAFAATFFGLSDYIASFDGFAAVIPVGIILIVWPLVFTIIAFAVRKKHHYLGAGMLWFEVVALVFILVGLPLISYFQ